MLVLDALVIVGSMSILAWSTAVSAVVRAGAPTRSGWARTDAVDATLFTDGLDRLSIEQIPYGSPSSDASFRSDELPSLRRSTPGFQLRKVGTVRLPAREVVLAKCTASAADPASGTPVRQDVQRYELWHAGQRAVLTVANLRGRPDPMAGCPQLLPLAALTTSRAARPG